MMASFPMNADCVEINLAQAKELAVDVPSAVGHTDTAAVFTTVLGLPVSTARVTVQLVAGDQVLVGQYSGPRLPEGATQLPEGATIKWVLVSIS